MKMTDRIKRNRQTLSPRLRTAPANTQGNTLHRLRHPDDKQTHQARNFITPSRAGGCRQVSDMEREQRFGRSY